MYYVYILLLSNGDYYKGCTNNIEDRIQRHQKGWIEATNELLPIQLITFICFQNKYTAYQFEKYLKSGSGRAFMNKHLI